MRQFSDAITAAINATTQTKGGNNDPRFSLLSVDDAKSYYTGGTDGGEVLYDNTYSYGPYSLSVARDGDTIYVCYESQGKVYLLTRSGGAWSTQTVTTSALSNQGNCSVAVVNGAPYVAYIDTSNRLYVWKNGTATLSATDAYYGAKIVAFGSDYYIFYVDSSHRANYVSNYTPYWQSITVSTAHTYGGVSVSCGLNANEINVYLSWYESGTGNVVDYVRYTYTGANTLTKTDTVQAYVYGGGISADFVTAPVIVDGVEVVPAKAVQYSSTGVRVGAMAANWKDIAWGAWTGISNARAFAAANGVIAVRIETGGRDGKHTIYLFEYSGGSATNLTPYFIGGTINQANGSAIAQFNCTMLPQAFDILKPGIRLTASMSFGNTGNIPLGTFYVDEVSYSALSDSVSVSARNAVGYLLSSGTYGFGVTYSSQTPNEAVELILSAAGVEDYTVQGLPNVSLDWTFAENASFLDDITKTIGGRILGLTVYETPSGEVIVGADAWIAQNYKSVGTYNYADGTLFARQIRKSIDPVYSRLLASSGVSGIVPSTNDVPIFDGWKTPYKAYYEQVSGSVTTQADFDAFVADLLARIQLAGHTENYTSPIRPQLEVGDIAQYNGTTLGIVTQVSHSFGKDGFKTSFSVDSGGAIADESGTTVTKTRGIDGYTRRQNLADLVRKIAKE